MPSVKSPGDTGRGHNPILSSHCRLGEGRERHGDWGVGAAREAMRALQENRLRQRRLCQGRCRLQAVSLGGL